MRYLRMPMSGGGKVTVPHLNGGVNIYDVPNRVGDNQLTECDNLWWHRGALRTRPGLAVADKWEEHDTYTAVQRVGEQELLMTRFGKEVEKAVFYAAHMRLHANGYSRLCGEQGYFLQSDEVPASALGIRAQKNEKANWYFLLANGDIIKDTSDGWVDAEPYIPVVMINGVGDKFEGETKPFAYEDYNMLTRAFQYHYTPDGVSYNWPLPSNLSTDLPGVKVESEKGGTVAIVELDVYGENGLRTKTTALKWDAPPNEIASTVSLSKEEAGVEGSYSDIEVRFSIDLRKNTLRTELWGMSGAQKMSIGTLPESARNSLRVTMWRSREYEKDRLTICNMTRGEWFGGDRSGIAGGTRFFVCGNPDEPDLLCWSGIEHPLYFPEHNRVRVGDNHQALTAMGKQGSLLVLYKEREMYALQYSAGTESDYAFAESGGVAVTSYMAKFLLTPINASIGCDCPNTVRLVNNRLVWACSDGGVYVLTAVNQYSERNVRMISRNVRRLLTDCGKEALRTAQAGEYEGHYLLLAGNRVFVMNTQTSAFANFNYYDDENAAAKAIPWYVWTLPEHLSYAAVVSGENTMLLAVTDPEKGEGAIAALEGATDFGEPIHCRMTTKLWDLGILDRKKSVEQIYMGLSCEDLSRLQVTYITERGRIHDPYRMQNSLVSREGYLPRRRLTPGVRLVQAFGLCLDSPAGLELDEIQMKIRQQGVVR